MCRNEKLMNQWTLCFHFIYISYSKTCLNANFLKSHSSLIKVILEFSSLLVLHVIVLFVFQVFLDWIPDQRRAQEVLAIFS